MRLLLSEFCRNMIINRGVFFMFVLTILSLGRFSTLLAVDELWEQSVGVVENSEVWIPGRISMHQKVLNSDGRVEGQSDAVFTLRPQGEQFEVEIQDYFLEADEKIEQIQTELIQEFVRRFEATGLEIPDLKKLSIQSIPTEKLNSKPINEEILREYKFTTFIENRRCFGSIWVNPKDHFPRMINIAQTNINLTLGSCEVLHFYRSIEFEVQDGAWKIVRETRNLWVEYKSLFKAYLRVFESHLEFENHWSLEVQTVNP